MNIILYFFGLISVKSDFIWIGNGSLSEAVGDAHVVYETSDDKIIKQINLLTDSSRNVTSVETFFVRFAKTKFKEDGVIYFFTNTTVRSFLLAFRIWNSEFRDTDFLANLWPNLWSYFCVICRVVLKTLNDYIFRPFFERF